MKLQYRYVVYLKFDLRTMFDITYVVVFKVLTSMRTTGGGSPSTPLSPNSERVANLDPANYRVIDNLYDSDAIFDRASSSGVIATRERSDSHDSATSSMPHQNSSQSPELFSGSFNQPLASYMITSQDFDSEQQQPHSSISVLRPLVSSVGTPASYAKQQQYQQSQSSISVLRPLVTAAPASYERVGTVASNSQSEESGFSRGGSFRSTSERRRGRTADDPFLSMARQEFGAKKKILQLEFTNAKLQQRVLEVQLRQLGEDPNPTIAEANREAAALFDNNEQNDNSEDTILQTT